MGTIYVAYVSGAGPMSGVRTMVAAGMLSAVVAVGCAAAPGTSSSHRSATPPGEPAVGRPSAGCDRGGAVVQPGRGGGRGGRWWPGCLIGREGPTVAARAVAPAAGLAYVLVSRTVRGLRGLYALERLSLRTGAVH